MIRHKDQQILQMFLASIPADRLQLLIEDHVVDLLQVAPFILYNLVLELHECVFYRLNCKWGDGREEV